MTIATTTLLAGIMLGKAKKQTTPHIAPIAVAISGINRLNFSLLPTHFLII